MSVDFHYSILYCVNSDGLTKIQHDSESRTGKDDLHLISKNCYDGPCFVFFLILVPLSLSRYTLEQRISFVIHAKFCPNTASRDLITWTRFTVSFRLYGYEMNIALHNHSYG